ncbi:hypothetical protein P3G55_21830 [Leptospira sp. 96542]|nr:hypothetical protein [Leptospira sp. 96542]
MPFFLPIIWFNFLFYRFIYEGYEIYDISNFVITTIFIALFFSILFTYANSLMLMMIYQLESGKTISLISAFTSIIGLKFLACLIVSVFFIFKWTIQGFLIGFIITLENIFNINLYNNLTKYARIEISMILPAILWEEMGFNQARENSLKFNHEEIHKYSNGFYLTAFLDIVLAIPIFLIFIFKISLKKNLILILFTTNVSLILLTLFILTEQIYFAEHYLWTLKWKRAKQRAINERREIPEFKEISRPSILDNIPDLIRFKK